MAVNIFDPNYYRTANPEVAGLSDEQAFQHFREVGLTNPDPNLPPGFVESEEGGWPFSPLIDIGDLRAYWRFNSDLPGRTSSNSFQPNTEQLKVAYDHLSNFGIAEGREFSFFPTVYDDESYRSRYPDLGNLTAEQRFEHFRNFGLAEGRQASENFNVSFYLNENPDLQQMNLTNRQALEHYRICGIRFQDRAGSLPELQRLWEGDRVFNVEFYRRTYRDLAGLSDIQLFEHFKNFGLTEGRQASEEFDVRFYLNNNPDLLQAGLTTNQQALEHYRDIRAREKQIRLSTLSELWEEFDVFDREFYRNRYPDFAGLSDRQLFEHFRDFGIQEGRRSSASFDAQFYLNNHPDLQQAGFNVRQAIDHYIAAGFQELRQGAPIAPEVTPNNTPETASVFQPLFRNIPDPDNFGPSSYIELRNPSIAFGSVSPDDPVDFYRLDFIERATFELKGLTDNANLKILLFQSNPVPGIANPIVLAESNSTGNLPEQVIFERNFNLPFGNYYLVVEAAADLENSTDYTLPFTYQLFPPPAPLATVPPPPPIPPAQCFYPDDAQNRELGLTPSHSANESMLDLTYSAEVFDPSHLGMTETGYFLSLI